MRIRFVQTLIDAIRVQLDAMNNDKYNFFFFGGKNAGDLLNQNLMKYFKIPYRKTKITNANLFCIGSILDNIVVPKSAVTPDVKSKNCYIVGTGFMSEEKTEEKLIKTPNIKALRGQISKKRMEKLTNTDLSSCVLADAGILVSYMYPMNQTKKYDVGIIPHYIDKTSSALNNIKLRNYSHKMIDIFMPVEKVLKQICECEVILSSSLHGLIFADSYSIPNRQIILSDKICGGDYKYRDYYSSYNIDFPQALDLRRETITDDTIAYIRKSYSVPQNQVKEKQQQLVKIFEELAAGGKND